MAPARFPSCSENSEGQSVHLLTALQAEPTALDLPLSRPERVRRKPQLCIPFSPLLDKDRAMHMTECRAWDGAGMTPLRGGFGGTFVRREAATDSDEASA